MTNAHSSEHAPEPHDHHHHHHPDDRDAVLRILIPCFNDADALAILLPAIDDVLHQARIPASVLVVDDGSTRDPAPVLDQLPLERFRALRNLETLVLRRNLGHQRAIAIGLAFLERRRAPLPVVVMDADGEDDPADIPRLVAKSRETGGRAVVFAQRLKRSESRAFRIGYAAFKILHRLLVGRGVNVGNFSLVPPERLSSLVVVSEMWNHYAAAVVKSRQPQVAVPTRRAPRLAGESRMNAVALVIHGLSAISVYADTVGVRLLAACGFLILALCAAAAWVIYTRLMTDAAIPGWATTALGFAAVLLGQAALSVLVFCFVILVGRTAPTFLPARDFPHFIRAVRPHPRAARQPEHHPRTPSETAETPP